MHLCTLPTEQKPREGAERGMTMAEWPPTKWHDIDEYDGDEIVAGYTDYRKGDLQPGPNRSPGYRWGWQNNFYDHNHLDGDDGFVAIRSEGARQYVARRRA